MFHEREAPGTPHGGGGSGARAGEGPDRAASSPEEIRNRRRETTAGPLPPDRTPAFRRAPGPASQGAPGRRLLPLPAPGPSVPELAGSSARLGYWLIGSGASALFRDGSFAPDAFVYEGLGGGPRGQRRSCSFSGTWRRGPLGPFADCCLEASPLALSLCAPSPRSSRAEQPAWWEGRGRRVGSDPHLRALLGCGAGAPCLVPGEMSPVAPVLGCPYLLRGPSGVAFPGYPQTKGWRF